MDSTVRATERRLMIEGSPEAGAQLLVARVRAGEISTRDVDLAAYLGHPVARAIAGRRAPSPSEKPRRWARGLAKYGEDVSARAVLLLHQFCSRSLDGVPEKVGWRARREHWHRAQGQADPEALPPEWDVIEAEFITWRDADPPSVVLAREHVLAAVAAYDELRLAREWYRAIWPVSHIQFATSHRAHEVLEAALMVAAVYLSPTSGGMTNRNWGRNAASEALRVAISSDLLTSLGFPASV